MGYQKDGTSGLDAMKYHNTVPVHETDIKAVLPGDDTPRLSTWVRHAAATGRPSPWRIDAHRRHAVRADSRNCQSPCND